MNTLTIEQMLALLGSFTVVALFLAGFGKALNRVIFPAGVPKWRKGKGRFSRLWLRTMPLHPIVGGMLVGFVAGEALSIPEFLGVSRIGAVLWFSVSGIFALPIHARVENRIEDDENEDDENGNAT